LVLYGTAERLEKKKKKNCYAATIKSFEVGRNDLNRPIKNALETTPACSAASHNAAVALHPQKQNRRSVKTCISFFELVTICFIDRKPADRPSERAGVSMASYSIASPYVSTANYRSRRRVTLFRHTGTRGRERERDKGWRQPLH